jgi:hypothetical protein
VNQKPPILDGQMNPTIKSLSITTHPTIHIISVENEFQLERLEYF